MFNVTPEIARTLAETWCDAWNRHDLDAVMEHYADDVAFCSPTVVKRWAIADGWLNGKERLRENFSVGIATEGLRFELLDVLTSVGAMCVIYKRETGQIVTDMVELDDAGKGKRVVASYSCLKR